ncbi:hypothetical protein [Corynebacterium ammoniagenes]|uniref:Uncharacterized protein n=1 Tax=Corynebacterium ammoniagenes TaxID=1697 RepID=A0AAV5G8H5_CORAM|nr:hypothetical protein [Corynebacterium ammoniagenes]GJN43616.1 hypothetical protein CAT723_20950 [Corynebacterium ammoniagenes]
MNCPNCNGANVQISFVEQGTRTASHGTGLGGNMNNTARTMTALGTLGMSNLVWKKSRGTHKTKTKNVKTALCQDCGKDWKMK